MLKKIENQGFENHISETDVKYHFKLHRYFKKHVRYYKKKLHPFGTRETLPYKFKLSLEPKSCLNKNENQGFKYSYLKNYCELPFQFTQIY